MRLTPVPGAFFAFQVEARRNGSAPITIGLTCERIDKLQELAALAGAAYEVRVVKMGKKPVPGEPFLFEEMASPVPAADSARQPRPATPPSHASRTPGGPATVPPAPAAPRDPERGAAPSRPTADQAATLCVRADPAAEIGGSAGETVTGLVAAPTPAGPPPNVTRPTDPPAASAAPRGAKRSTVPPVPPRPASAALVAVPAPVEPASPEPPARGPALLLEPAGSLESPPEPESRGRRSLVAEGPVRGRARAAWYKRRVAELWLDLVALPREAVALHLLLSDLAFQRGSLPEDEAELRRVVGVGEGLWHFWPEVRDLWPVHGLRRGRTRSRINPTLGEAFSDASEAVAAYRKRGKKGAAGRWKKGRADDASSNASSNASSIREAMQRRVEKSKSRKKKEGGGNGPLPEQQAVQERGQKGPALEEVLGFARQEGISEDSARTYHGKRSETGWVGVLNWREGLRAWGMKDARDAAKARANPARGTSALVGKSTTPPAPGRPKRDPFGPGVPEEVRAAGEKRRIDEEWIKSGGKTAKAQPFLPPSSYGPDSRNDERERLLIWEGGNDEAFTRQVAKAAGDLRRGYLAASKAQA